MKELIKALSKIEEGIAEVRNIITVEDQKKPSVTEDKEEKVAEKEASEDGSVYSKEELEAMKYNDLKKLGREVGVDVKGTRDELVKRILDATTDLPMPEPVEEENEEQENETVPTKTKDSVIEVPTVVTASDLLAFVNEEDNREGSRMFTTASSALEWAKKHNYDFPNYMKE